jgi:hypothetical protein
MASLIAFVQAHQMALSVLGVAVIDFAIDLSPGLKSNSIISLLLSFLVKKSPQA